ncbi:MAG: hypothetical protein DK841_08810 [Candidatus Melainabacteria bacterium]|nr:MAG: hypothetical protein DK841_08810 [Candidatus Melainabacteria bacterium]
MHGFVKLKGRKAGSCSLAPCGRGVGRGGKALQVFLFHALRAGMLLVAKALQNHRHANVHIKLKTRIVAE